jgi:mono/diheme cytochrome c family protein
MMRKLNTPALLFITSLLVPSLALPQEAGFGLSSPTALQESGFLRFLLPRFSLKTGIRIALEADNPEATISTDSGWPLMEGLGQIYYLQITEATSPKREKAQRFAAWLDSDIGRRTIAQFELDGRQIFAPIETLRAAEAATIFDGNATRGEEFSFTNCGRCHVVGDRNRMKGIGSTPSFPVLRSLPDWEERFSTFYARIPHPSLVQLEGVSEPFNPAFPPVNQPLRLTLDQLEDILTFVSGITPADLGAPLVEH